MSERYRPGAVPDPAPDAARANALRLLYAVVLCHFTAMGLYFAAIQLFVEDELLGSKAAVGISVGAFSITAVLVRPTVGRGIDVRGRKPFLLAGLGALLVSSLGFLGADSVAEVVVLRLVQGISGGCVYTTVAATATDLAPRGKRAAAIARLSLFLYAGFALGPAIAEALIDRVGFEAVWALASGLAVVAMAIVWFVLPESGTDAMAVRKELGPGPRRLLHPAAVAPGIVLATTGMGYASVTGFSSLYARHVGVSAGLLYAVFAGTVIGVRLVSGTLADNRGSVRVALPGMVLTAVGLGTLSALQHPPTAVLGVALFGAGFALVFPALMAFTVDRVDEHERGEVLGSFTAFNDIGSGGGAYLIGAIADAAGFGAAYATPAVLCAAGAVLLAVIGRRPARVPAGR